MDNQIITDALDYWSDSGATLEDVTALAEWMTARKWSPTGKAEEDLLLVCAGYSDLCVERHCTGWVPMLAMDGWEDGLATLLEVGNG